MEGLRSLETGCQFLQSRTSGACVFVFTSTGRSAGAKARDQSRGVSSRSAEALLPPHECGGSHPFKEGLLAISSFIVGIVGAEEGTRTPTPLRVHGPEPCASANSATPAKSDSVTGRPLRRPLQERTTIIFYRGIG